MSIIKNSPYRLGGSPLALACVTCLAMLLTACSEQKSEAVKANARTSPLHALSDNKAVFEQPSKSNQITFPWAHSPKKSYQQEWWYITANLTTEHGQKLATQWTLFRRAVADKHWYFAHAALADSQHHQSAYRTGREEMGNVTFSELPFAARIDDWQWQSSADFLPARLSYSGVISQHDEADTPWQVELDLSAESVFYLQGEQGFSQKHHSLAIASHYYSQPFIEVSGRVFWQGKWLKVTGKSWLDREWGSQMLALDQQGWDWFSLRLNDDTALMVYQIRSTKKDYLYGSLMFRDGQIRPLNADEIHVTKPASSTTPQHKYPQAFNIQLPTENINIDVEVVNNQQIMRFGIEYFEGMVTFSGSHHGDGFVEMTGYE